MGIPTPVNETLTALIKTMTVQEKTGYGVLRIDGEVVQPVSLDRAAIRGCRRTCLVDVGTVVPGMKGKAIRVKGLLDVPALKVSADHVTFHSLDGRYAATLTLEQAREYGLLLFEANGEPLQVEKGGPFRLLTPGLNDLCANVKGVGRIELRVGPGKDSRPPAEDHTHC